MWAPVVKRLGRFCPLLLTSTLDSTGRRRFPHRDAPPSGPSSGALSPTSGACPVCRNLVVPFQLLSGLDPRLGVRHQMQHALRATQGQVLGAAPSEGTVRKPNQALGRARSTRSSPEPHQRPPPGGLAGALPGLLGLQHSAIRNHSMVQIAPQRDQQFARQGHDPHPPRTAASRPIPFLKP